RIGNKKTLLLLSLLNAACLAAMVFLRTPHFVGIIFIFYMATNSLIVFSLDVFLQQYSNKDTMGDIRGIFLSITGLAWVAGPLIAGVLITRTGHFQIVYLIALLFTLSVFFLLLGQLRHFKDPK